MLFTVLLLLLRGLAASYTSTQQAPSYSSDSLMYIGPHNIRDHYFSTNYLQKSTHQSIFDAIKSAYTVTPIKRDLECIQLSEHETFDIVIKREVAWTYPSLNEFGLLSCDSDLKFMAPIGPVSYIELIPDGRRIFIQKFDNQIKYQNSAQTAKDLQTNCLIKSLEKSSTGSSLVNCTK